MTLAALWARRRAGSEWLWTTVAEELLETDGKSAGSELFPSSAPDSGRGLTGRGAGASRPESPDGIRFRMLALREACGSCCRRGGLPRGPFAGGNAARLSGKRRSASEESRPEGRERLGAPSPAAARRRLPRRELRSENGPPVPLRARACGCRRARNLREPEPWPECGRSPCRSSRWPPLPRRRAECGGAECRARDPSHPAASRSRAAA